MITEVSVEITKTTHSLNEIKYFQLIAPNILDVKDWADVGMPVGNRKTAVRSPLRVNVLSSLVMFLECSCFLYSTAIQHNPAGNLFKLPKKPLLFQQAHAAKKKKFKNVPGALYITLSKLMTKPQFGKRKKKYFEMCTTHRYMLPVCS